MDNKNICILPSYQDNFETKEEEKDGKEKEEEEEEEDEEESEGDGDSIRKKNTEESVTFTRSWLLNIRQITVIFTHRYD